MKKLLSIWIVLLSINTISSQNTNQQPLTQEQIDNVYFGLRREQILTVQNDSLKDRINFLNDLLQKQSAEFLSYMLKSQDTGNKIDSAQIKFTENAVEKQKLLDKSKNLSLSIQAGYNPFTGKAYGGVGIGFDLFRFGL